MPNWFYIDANGQKQGPVSDSQLKTLAEQQVIQPNTLLATDTGKRGTAGQIRGLFPADSPAPARASAEESISSAAKMYVTTKIGLFVGVGIVLAVFLFFWLFNTTSPPPTSVEPPPIVDTIATEINKRRLSTEEIISDVEGSVALIQGKRGSGSGFVVLPGVIVTNFHVVVAEFINELEVFFPSEKGNKHGPFTAELLYAHSDRDIAFLKLNTNLHKPLAIVDDYRFRRGQDIIAIGSPGRGDGKVLENAVSKGVLSTKTEMENYEYYQLNIAVNPGNSGGPVLNDEGFVIGVITLKAKEIEATAYCIPPNELQQTIEMVRKESDADIQKSRKTHEESMYVARGMAKLEMLSELADVPQTDKDKFVNEALEDFEKAIQRAPNAPLAWFGRGIFRIVNGDVNNGLADMDKAVELAKVHKPEIEKEMADVRDKVKGLIAQAQSGNRRGLMPFGGPGGLAGMPFSGRVPFPMPPPPPSFPPSPGSPRSTPNVPDSPPVARPASPPTDQTPAPSTQARTPPRMAAFGPLQQITFAVERYHRDVGLYPTTAQGLNALRSRPEDLPDSANWNGPYLPRIQRVQERMMTDPWGNPYRYTRPGTNGRNFDIWSPGPDGVDNTADDVGHWMDLRDLQ